MLGQLQRTPSRRRREHLGQSPGHLGSKAPELRDGMRRFAFVSKAVTGSQILAGRIGWDRVGYGYFPAPAGMSNEPVHTQVQVSMEWFPKMGSLSV